MRILFIIAHIGKGGGQVTQSIRLIKELAKNHTVKLLTLEFESAIVDEPCETIYAGKLAYPRGIFDLWKQVRKLKKEYDVVQCLDSYYALPAAWLSGKRPFFLRLGLSQKGDFKSRGRHLLSNFADILLIPLISSSGFVVNSRSLQTEMSRFNPVFIPNGYEISSLQTAQSRKELRKKLDLPPGFLLLYTGKIIQRKKLEKILAILPLLQHTKLILVGNTEEDRYGNSYYQKLKQQFAHTWDKVITTGEVHMEQVKDYLHAADAFVFPSMLEGSPNAVLEAMAAGLPVVCSAIENHKEIIEDHKTGLLFSTKEELLHHINALTSDPQLGSALAREAKMYIKTHHDIQKAANQYLQLYRKALHK